MPWWGWLAVGAALLAAEVAVQTELWLAVLGAAALAMGLALTLGVEGPAWAQWAAFAALAVAFNVSLRRRFHEKWVSSAPGLDPALLGETGVALEAIAPGAIGAVELRGSTWRAQNVGEAPLDERAAVRVEAKDGIVLHVRGA